jgi:hypothetical protein
VSHYSQGSQDEVLQAIFEKIGTTNKCCVEFGFDSDELTGGNGANTARLILEDDWTGLLMDQGRQNLDINLWRETLTPENLAEVFVRHRVGPCPDYVSIDVDSVDLWLFRAMLEAGYRPRVVSVEYNPNYSLAESVTARPGTTWQNGDRCYGASLAALYRVGQEFGYHLIDAVVGMDVFFVRGDLCDPVPLAEFAKYTQISWHTASTPERIASIMVEYR